MKALVFAIGSVSALVGAYLVGCFCSEPFPERLLYYGPRLRVGGKMPPYVGADVGAEGGVTLSSQRFHILVLGAGKGNCLDIECLPDAEEIVRKGGHIQMLEMKIDLAYGITYLHDGVTFRPADKLVVVGDSGGNVLAIFRNADESDWRVAMDAALAHPKGLDFYNWSKRKAKVLYIKAEKSIEDALASVSF